MQRRTYTLLISLVVLTVLLQASVPWLIPPDSIWLGVGSALFTSTLVLALGGIVVLFALAIGRRSLSHHDALHAAFERAREDYVRLFHTTPEGIFTADSQFTLQTLNLSGARILGAAEPSALIGKRFPSICADPNAGRLLLERVTNQKTPVLGELLRLKYRGEQDEDRWIDVTCQARRDQSGVLVGIEGIFRDVSDRVRAEMKATERFEKLQSAYLELGRVNRHLALLEELCLLHTGKEDEATDLVRAGLRAAAAIVQADAGIAVTLEAIGSGGRLRDHFGLQDVPRNRSMKIPAPLQRQLHEIPAEIALSSCTGSGARNLEALDFHWAFFLPCVVHGIPVGLIELYRRTPPTEAPNRPLLQAIGAQVALVLSRRV